MQIDNEMYFKPDLVWWDDSEDSLSALLRYGLNPLRFAFFRRVLAIKDAQPTRLEAASRPALLDVGCGGGFLAEEFAKIGLRVTGLDPSGHLLQEATAHARKSQLEIDYVEGYAEKLPFANGAFDYLACCDVLEHVDDLERAISEIARVLKPGGVFFFDTVNRTLASWLLVIKVAQDWKFTAWEAPRTHVWSKFIRPAELQRLLAAHGLSGGTLRGIAPANNLLENFLSVRRRAQGKISRREMAKRFGLRETNDTSISYMGFATKEEGNGRRASP